MKSINIILVAALLSVGMLLSLQVKAQSPEKMSYQSIVRDASGQLITNQEVGMQISILQGMVSGTPVYIETQNPSSNANGLVSIEIGGDLATVTSGIFADIDWAVGSYFIQIDIDPEGGDYYTITGTSQLMSVPYALHAKTAIETDPAFLASPAANISETTIVNLTNLSGVNTGDQDLTAFIITEKDSIYTAWDKSYTDLTNKPILVDTIRAVLDTTTQFVKNETQNLSDVLSLDNDAGNIRIKNVAPPVDDMDVITLSYLDRYAHGGVDDSKLTLWNKLGSEVEILNSETGENGELVGSGHNYEIAKFDNGYVRTNVSSYIKFPSSVLENRRTSGSIEFWVNPKVAQPLPYHYGAFMLVGDAINGTDAFAFVRWGDGTTGVGISGGVNFDGTIHKTPEEPQQFSATVGIPFYISLVWDVNGIDGTSETVRIYRDGVVIGVNTDTWNDNATTTYDHFYIGTGPDAEAYDKYIIDNIKVWDYAKIDYSDNSEGMYMPPLFIAGDGIDITDNVISGSPLLIAGDGISIADNVISGIPFTETDSIYNAWDKSYNDLTNKPVISDTVNTILAATSQFVRIEIDGSITNEIELPTDVTRGDMVYYTGGSWEKIAAPSTESMVLTYCDGTPTWTDGGSCPQAFLGDFRNGGVIFYLDGTGKHGLVCAVDDHGESLSWGCRGTEIGGADGVTVGTGAQNTIEIEAGCTTPGTAADICANLVLNGYADWFLPSKDELNIIYQNKDAINTTALNNGGSSFVDHVYWSSTEYSGDFAVEQSFVNGFQSTVNKNMPYQVRAIRAF